MGQAISTFCYERDFDRRDEWLGGGLMALASNSASTISAHQHAGHATEEHDIPVDEMFEHRPFDPDWRHARNSGKPMTLRSWRNPHSIGGSFRKGAVRKIAGRLQLC